MRAVVLLGGDANRWLHLNRCMGLSWAIQTEADPENDNSNNPGLPADRLDVLRNAWMSLSTERLEWAFATHRFRAPTPDALNATGGNGSAGGSGGETGGTQPPPPTETGRYAQMQNILETASGANTSPFHGGLMRFWLKPRDEFISLTVYGHKLIADPGPDRGARSPLVQVLKDELQDVLQMPLNRPPLEPAQIQFIQDWVDADCPVE